jgi:hypothetical protein
MINPEDGWGIDAGAKRELPSLRPVGVIRSSIASREHAPKHGFEGAPDVWLEVFRFASDAVA